MFYPHRNFRKTRRDTAHHAKVSVAYSLASDGGAGRCKAFWWACHFWTPTRGISEGGKKWPNSKCPYLSYCDGWCLFCINILSPFYIISHFCFTYGLLDSRLYLPASFASWYDHIMTSWPMGCQRKRCVQLPRRVLFLLFPFPASWNADAMARGTAATWGHLENTCIGEQSDETDGPTFMWLSLSHIKDFLFLAAKSNAS